MCKSMQVAGNSKESCSDAPQVLLGPRQRRFLPHDYVRYGVKDGCWLAKVRSGRRRCEKKSD